MGTGVFEAFRDLGNPRAGWTRGLGLGLGEPACSGVPHTPSEWLCPPLPTFTEGSRGRLSGGLRGPGSGAGAGRAWRDFCFSLPEGSEALQRAPVPGTASRSQLRTAQLPLPSVRRGHKMEWTWGRDKEPGRTLSHPQGAQAAAAMVTSASCLIHLKQQKGGRQLPARAAAAWGCLQLPRVGFPERDSKPDILRLQNTQVSRAKNSCPRAPGAGKGACWLRRWRAGLAALTSSLLPGAQLLSLQSGGPLPRPDWRPLSGQVHIPGRSPGSQPSLCPPRPPSGSI